MFATPHKRIVSWAVVAWFVVREMQVLLTLVTLPGTVGARFGHWYFWDGWDYGIIARYGYAPWYHSLAAYSPLYPLLAHVLILASAPWQAAMLITSNLAGLAAIILVGFFVYHETWHEQAAIWATLLLAVSPLGVFLSGMYPDGLFIALAAGAWLAARSGHWRIAGVLLALAIITRPFGIVLALALAIEFQQSHQRWRVLPWVVLPSILTGGAFLLVLWRSYGSPLVTFTVERTNFGHALLWPWQTLWLAGGQLTQVASSMGYPLLHELLDLLPFLIGLASVIVLANRWPHSYTTYVGTIVLLCLLTPVVAARGQYAVISDGRYMYAAAPLLLIPLGCLLTRWPRWASVGLLTLSLIGQMALVVFQLHGGWLV